MWIGEFSGVEEKEVELVVYASDPKTTTVKAWLNEEMVLLPSELPRARATEVRVPLTIVEGDVLEVRLSGKPGNRVAFWLEEGADPDENPEDPDQGTPDPEIPGPETPATPPYTFNLTSGSYGITSNMNEICSSEFSGSRIADWTEVVDAVDKGMAGDEIFNGFYAFVLNNGAGLVSDFLGSYHHIISTVGGTGTTFGFIGTDFTLTSTTGNQQILCVTNSS